MVLFQYVIESAERLAGIAALGSIEARRTHPCN